MPRKNKNTKNPPKTEGNQNDKNAESDTKTTALDKSDKKGLCLPLDKKLKLQIKKQKKKEKKMEFEAGNKSIGKVPKSGDLAEVSKPEIVNKNGVAGIQAEETKPKINFQIETIPEDLFEEFIENEEIVQTREAIRAFPRTSPQHSPKPRKKDATDATLVKASIMPSVKVLYNYNGASYSVPCNEGTTNPQELERKLDVIAEESDCSDASGQSDRKIKRLKEEWQSGLPIETFPEEPKCEENGDATDWRRLRPVITETAKRSDDVMKIVLAESDTEGDSEINQSETSGEYEIISTGSGVCKFAKVDDDDISKCSFASEREDSQRRTFCSNGYESDDSEIKIFITDVKRGESTGERILREFLEEVNAERVVCNEEPIKRSEAVDIKKVSVKSIAEAIKGDMDRVLESKMKIIQAGQTLSRSVSQESSQPSDLQRQSSDAAKSDKISRHPWSVRNPAPLSDIAEKKVLSMPYGRLVLRKIGLGKCCWNKSESIKSSEEEIYSRRLTDTSSRGEFSDTEQDQPPKRAYVEFDYSNPEVGGVEKWYGMPTDLPDVLLGLSPSQRRVYEEKQNRFYPEEEEASNLLDLHRKFLERSYSDSRNSKQNHKQVYITEISGVNKPEKPVIDRRLLLARKSPIGNGKPENAESVSTKPNKNRELKKEEGRCNEKLEAVGNSRLLAFLQNAISDEFALDSNSERSCETHEFPLVRSQTVMTETEGNHNYARNESGDRGNFSHIWSREKNRCNVQSGKGDAGTRARSRPKTICCQMETEPKIGKETRARVETAEESSEIDTKNLPSVLDVIKAFEEPGSKVQIRNHANGKTTRQQIGSDEYRISKRGDVAQLLERRKEHRRSMPPSILSEQEIFKQKMYDEYMSKLAERIERRQQKVIKLSRPNEIECPEDIKFFDIENEFINKVKERKEKLGMTLQEENVEEGGGDKDFFESLEKKCQEFRSYWEAETSSLENGREEEDRTKDANADSASSKRSSVQLLLDATSDVDTLPKHLREFLLVEKEEFPEFFDGVWSPARKASDETIQVKEENEERKKLEDEPIPPVWTPKSAQASPVLERKEFRPVNFESPTLPRKKYIQDDKRESSVPPPWQQPGGDKPPELAKSPSSPVLSLPKAPNPTVTLLQKAREGHLPRGAHYLNSDMNDSPKSEGSTIQRLEIVPLSKTLSDFEKRQKGESEPIKIIGIGPTTKEGIPLVLRSEVNDENKEKWYKRMYDSLHKYGKDDDFVTVKYRTSPSRKGFHDYHQGSSSGYQSEPELINYDRSANRYVTLDRRRTEKSKERDCVSVTLPKSRVSPPRRDFREYKNQPRRIEDYEPGHSSISELEANKWWDEVLEIFDRWLDKGAEARGSAYHKQLSDAVVRTNEEEKSRSIRKPISPRSFTNYASGFISDPQYVYKRTEDEFQSPPSSEEQKEAYKIIQKGGEIPLRGLRKPAPERPKDSIDTEIEYFPLSPTLTRIRVHKQNITPLKESPFYLHPALKQPATLNYPTVPFGVCNSFSQVQIYSPFLFVPDKPLEACGGASKSSEGQKFSVQLQNISGPSDYIQIVPKPRSKQQKKSPVYANVPIRSCSPDSKDEEKGDTCERKTGTTFSDLKRVVPSVNSIPASEVFQNEVSSKLLKETKRKFFISKLPVRRNKTVSSKKIPEKVQKKPIAEKRIETTNKRSKTLLKRKPGGAKKQEEKPRLESIEDVDEDAIMSATYLSPKPKVEADVTDMFRSRSFSPDVKRKVFKFPDMNKPVPPKRSNSLQMWSKMMVSYPTRKSRYDDHDSNVSFLKNKIKRKLTDEKDTKTEFGDDVETVRTVKINKNGSTSIKTNRFVRVAQSQSRSSKPETKKKDSGLVKTTTRGGPKEEDRRKSVKVTVAISSKEPARKAASVVRKTPPPKTSSPCPSVSSYRSGLSGKEPLDKGSVSSPRVLSPQSTTSRLSSLSRSASPGSAVLRAKPEVKKRPVGTKSSKITSDTVKKVKTIKKDPVKDEKAKEVIVYKKPKIEKTEVERGRDLVRTDSFFQNLFLRGLTDERPYEDMRKLTSVLERARRYQRRIQWPEVYKSEPSLSLYSFYLNQKRPVSLSRFRNLDQESNAHRTRSPLGVLHSENFRDKLRRFDSLSQFGDGPFRDFSPDSKERSSSEPPLNRSQTASPEDKISRMSMSEVSSLRSSPNSSRSPSRRRIQSFKSESERKLRKARARSAGEIESVRSESDLGKSASSLNLSNFGDHAEYQAYVLELMHSSRKCERFRELYKFYTNLERLEKLEKTASAGDLRPRLRSEDVIDFDRWKKIRTKERAEAELKTLMESLVKVQKEKNLLFRAADVEAVRWKGDRGLRIKERSVEDLREQFSRYVRLEQDRLKGKGIDESVCKDGVLREKMIRSEGRTSPRIGKEYGHTLKAWSSLSNDQMLTLKDQLSEIYSQDSKRRGVASPCDDFEVVVPEDGGLRSPGEGSLYVRRNSAPTKGETFTPKVKRKEEARKEWKKADSASALASWQGSDEKISLPQLPWKDEVKQVRRKATRYPLYRSKSARSMPLSENEKKELSMTLSREVIEKMNRGPGKGLMLPKETLGALAAAGSRLRTSTVIDAEADKKIKDAPVTEVESGSGSSETSVKTVVRKDSADGVLKRVQYFETLQEGENDCKALQKYMRSVSRGKYPQKTTSVLSSSLENLNDYFGQQKQYATPYPSDVSKEVKASESLELRRSTPPRYRSTSPIFRSGLSESSNESLFSGRSRSVSPDPTKYYRAYLRMVKCGAVRKLCNKFESWEDLLSLSSDKDFWLPPPPRRFASDPELTRDLLRRFGTDPTKVTVRGQEVGDVRWLKTKFEKGAYPARGRTRPRRARSPLVRSPDRFMPRINVISKTAELQMRGLSPGPRRDVSGRPEDYRSSIDYVRDRGGYYYTGEVEKLRRKFERLQEAEALSILGQMYTSVPNVNELRDIAPYLECSWVAHRYPGVSKTASSPDLYATKRRETPKRTFSERRPHSSSPVRPKQPSSILKPTHSDPYADQKFDPSIHRPKYRYQPERETDRRCKKESVNFKSEPEILELSSDSPRKYVESEVTIHYKSPVRSEAKAMLSEDELARRQAESMKRIYKEERRRKYLQELQDMNNRRHTDNFIPSQKSPISLNRYDDFPDDFGTYYSTKGRDYTTDPVLVARGLYDFVGRRPRELGFRRGDIIFIIRKLDKNWCEGELNGVVGLFPLSYVEVIPYNEVNMKFGRARAKYDFVPQTSLELGARKGDVIALLRKIDENWFEGRIGDKTGIIPASYCHVLAMPQISRTPIRMEKIKPVAAPAAHSLIHNGGGGLSTKHCYAPYLTGPTSPGRSTVSSTSANYYDGHPSADALIDEALMQLDEEFDLKRSKPATQPLNVRINPRPEPELYQVLFNHVPNNDDELELIQGETVTVVEKCGDGWYIGSKTSDGKLGIFPGTHVRRIAPELV